MLLRKKSVQIIRSDDLLYDGRNLIIPTAWASSIVAFISSTKDANAADAADRARLLSFMNDVSDYISSPDQGN